MHSGPGSVLYLQSHVTTWEHSEVGWGANRDLFPSGETKTQIGEAICQSAREYQLLGFSLPTFEGLMSHESQLYTWPSESSLPSLSWSPGPGSVLGSAKLCHRPCITQLGEYTWHPQQPISKAVFCSAQYTLNPQPRPSLDQSGLQQGVTKTPASQTCPST